MTRIEVFDYVRSFRTYNGRRSALDSCFSKHQISYGDYLMIDEIAVLPLLEPTQDGRFNGVTFQHGLTIDRGNK